MLLPETLPCIKQAGSAWILRQICHDWPDQQVLQILKSVRAAMGAAKPPCTLCLVEVFCAASLCISGHFAAASSPACSSQQPDEGAVRMQSCLM